jgi:CCR4-NOT transcription complex subunit 2
LALKAVTAPVYAADEMEGFGLVGLSALTSMKQNDQTAFAIGQDINLLGLDLTKDSKILPNLSSPWAETSRSEVEPFFSLPQSIRPDSIIPPPEPCDNKIQSFSDETLFYIFYMRPRDTLQEYAARELVARNWRYHKDIQVWLTKDSNVEPVLISQDVEKGVYVFFDPHNWEKIKKEFVLHYSSVQA